MRGCYLKFNEIPQIGFAHHFSMTNYIQKYGIKYNGIEIVYIKSGGIAAELYGKNYDIEPGSVLVFDRSVPMKLVSKTGAVQTHCSVQIKIAEGILPIDSDTTFLKDGFAGILVPFITPPCQENEEIKKEIYSIISTIGNMGDAGRFSASLRAMGILSKLDGMYRQKLYSKNSRASILEYKIKHYVAENISKDLPLSKIAEVMGKTPNYLNSVFKGATGMGIHQYINKERVRTICEMMQTQGISFKKACECVSILDVSYGYRLFKKHTGVTPTAFLEGKHLVK